MLKTRLTSVPSATSADLDGYRKPGPGAEMTRINREMVPQFFGFCVTILPSFACQA